MHINVYKPIFRLRIGLTIQYFSRLVVRVGGMELLPAVRSLILFVLLVLPLPYAARLYTITIYY